MACKNPPPGWTCSRKEGHPGPCAALPSEAAEDWKKKLEKKVEEHQRALVHHYERIMDMAQRIDSLQEALARSAQRDNRLDAVAGGARDLLKALLEDS